MVDKSMFSSASAEWETPGNIYDYLNSINEFELDPCSTDENHKCSIYFTKETDGLSYAWHKLAERAFMNPVYGNAEYPCKPNCNKKKCETRGYHIDKYIPGIEDWVRKAYIESAIGKMLVVCLVPARTDTGWFQNYCMRANEIWLIEGRLSFINRTLLSYSPDKKPTPAPFPSAIVVFDGLTRTLPNKPVLKSMKIDKQTGEINVS